MIQKYKIYRKFTLLGGHNIKEKLKHSMGSSKNMNLNFRNSVNINFIIRHPVKHIQVL